uniref:Uncharacterized protein n=1 Tax=Anguilla anguilla TaxID=7936 RepID=A0A0E9S6V1_ANGAN
MTAIAVKEFIPKTHFKTKICYQLEYSFLGPTMAKLSISILSRTSECVPTLESTFGYLQKQLPGEKLFYGTQPDS